jgi:thiol-disulfide isomerase/thioredoxin
MFVAAILVVAIAAMIGLRISSSRAADDSSADKPATKAPAHKSSAAKSDPLAVPDGKTPALMSFIARMRKIKPPKNASDDDKAAFLQKAQSAIVEAADKVLDSKPASGIRVAVVKAKIEALLALKEMGDDSANNKLGAMADGLKDDKQTEVARLVKPYVGIAQTDTTGKTPKAPRPWSEMKPKLAAAPENLDLAKEAVASVQMLEQSARTEVVIAAYRDLGAILAKSKDPQIAAEAHAFDGLVRRLSLPGNPMQISGHLVDGPPVNTSALKGKVVLVDFWATWCGPCKAELPNVLANYEKYHSRGFEVVGVSCDQDKAALVAFIADKKLPWPIIFQQPGEASMANYYGITGIPTAILTNKKGEVISLNARGEELTRLLGEMLGK